MNHKRIITVDETADKVIIVGIEDDGSAYIGSADILDLPKYTEPDMEQVRKEAYDIAYKDAEEIYEGGKRAMYQKGLSDAWEAARKIWKYDTITLREIFGKGVTRMDWFMKFTASEAIEKIRQYEQEKQEEDEEVNVGDEVIGIYKSGEQTEPFVIVKGNRDYYYGIYSRTKEFCQGGLKLEKTGRHFPEIAAVLAKMKEA